MSLSMRVNEYDPCGERSQAETKGGEGGVRKREVEGLGGGGGGVGPPSMRNRQSTSTKTVSDDAIFFDFLCVR